MIRRFVLVFLVLCLPSFVFAQEFVSTYNASLYPSVSDPESFIPPSSQYAILAWSSQPSSINSNTRVISASIIPGPVLATGKTQYSYGWYVADKDNNTLYSWTVIDSSNFYVRGNTSLTSSVASQIQNILVEKNLGTVQQRAAFIAGFKVKNVNIIDTSSILASFRDLLGPWANIAVGLMIALFALEFGTRNTKQLAGEAAREARAADRRVQRREIRDDPIAGQFRAHMDNLASVFRDTYGYYDSSTRAEAKELFDQAALDYAKYKKSRGWAL